MLYTCLANYMGESAGPIIERVKDHSRIDTKSHVLKHIVEKEHVAVTEKYFENIGSHFKKQET